MCFKCFGCQGFIYIFFLFLEIISWWLQRTLTSWSYHSLQVKKKDRLKTRGDVSDTNCCLCGGGGVCLLPPCSFHRLTFMLLLWSAGLFHLLWGFHEKREDGPQAQDVHKLVAVIRSLRSNHPVVQDLQGAGPRQFLFSAAEIGNNVAANYTLF